MMLQSTKNKRTAEFVGEFGMQEDKKKRGEERRREEKRRDEKERKDRKRRGSSTLKY